MGTCVLEQKYRLETCVAKGGQGSLWRGTHRLGSPVAVKVCDPELAANAVQRQRFLDEAYISNKIMSEHVLHALDDGLTPDGAPFVVYPWVDGQNAEQLRARVGGRLPPRLVVAIAVQALGGLGAAHAEGIVHRDMKPENVLLDRNGHVYVIDWGGASCRADLGTRTAVNAFPPITPAYTAPEQARGERATPCSDVFAVGAMMLALIAGRWPRLGAFPLATLMEAAWRPLPRLRDLTPNVSDDLAAIVDQATAFEAAERYASAAAMWADLADILRRGGGAG